MKSKVMDVVRYILLVIIIVCVGILAKRFLDYRKAGKSNQYVDEIVEQAKKDVDKDIKEGKLKKNPWEEKEEKNLKVLESLQAINSDVKGFLEVPAAHISYPILHAADNDYYLRRDVNREYSIAGSIFMDAANDQDIKDDNTVIYGHHLEVDSMFTELTKFRKQDFAEVQTNRQMYITTNEGLREYQICMAFGVPSTYDYRRLNFADKKEKLDYFNNLKSISEVNLDTKDFEEDDQFVTLSTCDYDYDDQRLAVVGVRIR